MATRVPGERVKRTRLVRTDRYVIAVEVEAVVPADDPSEPCLEAETVQFLRRVREYAEAGHEARLRRHGEVYVAAEPATA